ncbi:hypothetical protein F66182_11545, partial [Fusarium sp. NRRL 66182]
MAGNIPHRAVLPNHGNSASELAAGPPPSTLAAQLVENISASTKSSKSDENSELKGFFAVIQRVKDDPTLLKTPEDRIEHNHMLIYVYSRAVLEGIRLDDPFLDRAQVHTEGLKAISFLRFSIKETPMVLKHRVTGQEYMFRGQEPLWVWLLPQLLRLLGHAQCLELTDAIEGFLQYMMQIVAQNWSLWDMAPAYLFYLRIITSHVLSRLQDPLVVPSVEDSFTTLNLPPEFVLDRYIDNSSLLTSQLLYSVDRMSQALQQLVSLCNVVAFPLISTDEAFGTVASFAESAVWLIDVLGDMRAAQVRFDCAFPTSSLHVLHMALQVERALSRKKGISTSIHKKIITLIILLCGEMTTNSKASPVLGSADGEMRRTYCMALAVIAKASIEDRSIGRLAISSFVDESSMFCSAMSEGTDIWRVTQTLRQVTVNSQSKLLSPDLHPSKFADVEVREAIEALSLSYDATGTSPEERAKHSLGACLGIEDIDENLPNFEQQF